MESEDVTSTLAPGDMNEIQFAFIGNLIGGNNYFFGEVQSSLDESPGDNLAMTIFDFMSSTFDPEIAKQYSVRPNPSIGQVFIEFDEALFGSQLKIYTIYGHLVKDQIVQTTKEIIELQQSGTYLVKVTNQKGFVATRKLAVIE